MKKNQFAIISATFFSGIVLGASIFGLISFTNPTPPVSLMPGVSKVSLQEASSYIRAYTDHATPSNEVIKGFVINKEQLDALNQLANENRSLSLFRIYMGSDANGNRVGILLGIDGQGSDASGSIYMATGGASPCPPVCDGNSSLMGQ